MIWPSWIISGVMSPGWPVVATTIRARSITSSNERDLDTGVAGALVRCLHGVGGDDLLGARLADEVRDTESGGAQAELADGRLRELDAGLSARDVDGAESRDGGAVDVVVHDGDVEVGDEACLDLEAVGSADVFQVDAAEAAGDALHGLDE